MSLDQYVACRRRPNLPDDLPQAAQWRTSMFHDTPIYTFDGGQWILHVAAESEFDPERREQLAEDLADAGIADVTPDDYGFLVSVTLEPVRAGPDGIELQLKILDMLIETCDGVVMAN